MATSGVDLYQLQMLDSEIDAARRRLAVVEAELGESEAVRRARGQAESARALVERRGQEQRRLEAEIGTLAEKIAHDEGRLYGGAIRNTRELSDLQAEVVSERRRHQQLEDHLLSAMIGREEAEEALAGAEDGLRAAEGSWSTGQSELRVEQAALRARLDELGPARAAVASRINPDDLTVYHSLRSRKGGVAVALIQDDACGACGVSVTQSRKWQLREGQLVTCSNCERILVLKGPS